MVDYKAKFEYPLYFLLSMAFNLMLRTYRYQLSFFLIINIQRIRYLLLIGFKINSFLLVFNATFNNISAISWKPVLVVEEVGVPGENHRPWASNW
jgi:hypothetical protein